MTRKELRKLAGDLAEGRAVGSWQVPEDMLTTVFAFTIFMDEAAIKSQMDSGIVNYWEHTDKALPRSCNGWPMFLSGHGLTRADMKRLRPELKRQVRLRRLNNEGVKGWLKEWTWQILDVLIPDKWCEPRKKEAA
jgi:hypothetical protein